MTITYIHHSCFLAETDSCYYLFDYEQGTLPPMYPCKPILVLASHGHHDHYQPQIFTLLAEAGMQQIHPILSSDISFILPETVQQSVTPPLHSGVIAAPLIVSPGAEYHLETGQTLLTLRSTDEGVAFLIKDQDEVIYHAGDLNEWYWEGEDPAWNEQMVLDYRAEIDRLAQKLHGCQPDAAFLVLDPRQEADYARGMLYFLETVGARTVFPMHYWDQPEIISRFLNEYPQYRDCIADTECYQHHLHK